jgi:hypothetical protein
MLFLDTACNMIDKCCRFRYTKIYILMNMSAECALCFLIKLKNSRYFYIIKSQFLYLTEQQTNFLDLISQFCARLDCQAFSTSQLSQLAGCGYI